MPRKKGFVEREFYIGETVRVISATDMKRYIDSHSGTCRAGFVSTMYKFCDTLCKVAEVDKGRRFVCLINNEHSHTFWFDYEMIQKAEEIECYKSEVLDSFLEGVMIE